MSGRGQEISRPNPWTIRAADRQSFQGWQYEVTGGGRIWYAIDDDSRTLWITRAGSGHPKQTDNRR